MGQKRTNKFFLLLLLTGFVFVTPVAWAATYTVSKTADTNDGTCDADCSFREAITAANGGAGNTVGFNIPSATDGGCIAGTGVCTISPTSALPSITAAMTVDGFTQSGAATNTNSNGDVLNGFNGLNTALKIVISGAGAGAGVDGITVNNVANVVIKGLNIRGFLDEGITITGASATGVKIQGCFIGLDVTGEVDSGNTGNGIEINTNAVATIGTDGDGVSDAAERNLISGNNAGGVLISGASGTVVAGNFIGTDKDGNQDLGNSTFGVSITVNGARIGTDGNGTVDNAEGNLISGNNNNGITGDANSDNSRVSGNFIGISADGAAALGNTNAGLTFPIGADGVLIGTNGDGVSDSLERNVSSGNSTYGIIFQGNSAVITGNIVGLDRSGSAALGNGYRGVFISGSGTRIGTNVDGVSDSTERNIISSNAQTGLFLSTATNSIVAGNYIGTASDGVTDRGNGLNGISVSISSASNTIGGTSSAAANIIAFNGDAAGEYGIRILGVGSVGNKVLRNAIFNNQNEGLIVDADGANNGQTAPTIVSSSANGTSVNISGTATNNDTVQLFDADSDNQEGQTFIGETSADGSGNWAISVGAPYNAANNVLVATTTNAVNGTSMFSTAYTVTNVVPVATEQTVSGAQGTNSTITLVGTDGNGDALTYKISTLPTQGSLYQTADGATLGTQITAVPTTVTDVLHRVIFVPVAGDNGNGYGNFGFKVNDGTVDSAEATITVNVTGLTITQSGGATNLTEGLSATDTYTVVLTLQPTADVVVALNPDAQVTVSPSTLTFTAVNWNILQTVTVAAVDDNAAEGNHTGTVTHTVTSADANFNSLSYSVIANITDNDSAGVSVTESGGSSDVTEGGATDSYTVFLTTQPTADVTITATPNAQVQASPATLTFTTANWSTPQTVTITAGDDNVVEGTHTGSITHTTVSTDLNYNGLTVNSITPTITDNDSIAVTNTSPAVYAGADFQALAATGTKLYGLASDADGDTLTYQWTQISGETVTLTDATQVEAHFTAPETVGDALVFELSVSDGQATVSDTVTVTVINKTISVSEISYQNFTNKVIAADGRGHVVKMSRVNGQTLLDLGDGYFVTMQSETPHALYLDGKIIITDPTYNESSGIVALIDKTLITDTTLDFDSTDFDLNAGVIAAHGDTPGDGFGYAVTTGDINGDGVVDIFVLAPGTTFGTVYILNGTTLEILHSIVGSADEPLKSPFLDALDLNGSDGAEALVGVGDAASPSLSVTRNVSNAETDTSRSFNGLLSRSDFPSVVDFAETQPDFVLNTTSDISDLVHGDVNNDGLDDAILASRTGERFAIIFGNSGIGTTQTVLDDSNAVSSIEATDYTSIATGDVNGDGVDDIIMGYADADSGNGKILVHLGTEVWTAADYDPERAVTLAGTNGSSIGQWLIVADSNDDGVPDIYTNPYAS